MPDMIVRLYDLPSLEAAHADATAAGFQVRRALAPEKPQVVDWAWANFGFWAPEVEVVFQRLPISCFLAVRDEKILGFSAYDAVCPNFFGPTGVVPELRGQGIGRVLLLAALHAQRAQGYAYAIIGGVGPADYYAKVVGAQMIDHSTPGIFNALPFKAPGA
ncbi:MAG: GNAT family N-acetyltransferase [Myxococcota bacterium]